MGLVSLHCRNVQGPLLRVPGRGLCLDSKKGYLISLADEMDVGIGEWFVSLFVSLFVNREPRAPIPSH